MSRLTRSSILALFSLGISGLLLAGPALAATTEHATWLDWIGVVGDFDFEDFESAPIGSPECPAQDADYGGCATSATVETEHFDIVLPMGWHSGGYDGVFADGVINGSQEYRADLHANVLVAGTYYNTVVFSRPITAFAVELAGVVEEVCYPNPECGPVEYPMTIQIGDIDHPVAYGSTFFAVTSDQPFSEVVWMNTRPAMGGYIIPSFDNLAFKSVPEPSTGLLLGLGLATLSRSKSRSTRYSRPLRAG